MVYPKVGVASSSYSANAGSATASLLSPVHLMSLPTIFVGILVLIVIAPLQAQPLIPAGNSQNFEYKSFCSKSLSDFLSLICGGRYSSQQYAQYRKFSTYPPFYKYSLLPKTKYSQLFSSFFFLLLFFHFLVTFTKNKKKPKQTNKKSSKKKLATADSNGAFNSNILRRLSTEDGIYIRARRIHECCLRPCGFSELKMLCEPPA